MERDFISRWIIFLRERYNPAGTLLMVFVFYLYNISGALVIMEKIRISPAGFILGYILVYLIFFRLRVFDEIKDYRTDIVKNPERPLPRGLISIKEANTVSVWLIFFEIIIVLMMGKIAIISYLFLLIFTMLMRYEFFMSRFLQGKTEVYALMHTFSASLMSLLIFSIIGVEFDELYATGVLAFCLSNWSIFNVFEFSRKTFGINEIPEDSDLYSERLGPKGAVALSAVNQMVALLLLIASVIICGRYTSFYKFSYIVEALLILSVVLYALTKGIIYIKNPDSERALSYRRSMEIYLILYPFFSFVLLMNLVYNHKNYLF